MHHNKLFWQTRWRLAVLYVGVMGIILGISGVQLYRMAAAAHQTVLDRELESLAKSLQTNLEYTLRQPGQLEPEVASILLPGLCQVKTSCSEPSEAFESDQALLGRLYPKGYYIRLLDLSRRRIASWGNPPEIASLQQRSALWQTVKDTVGNEYHQITLPVQTRTSQPWGTVQVGRSLQKVDSELAAFRVVLLLGLPTTMLLVLVASWWLAGLAMRPLYESYRQIQQFTTDVAHELRTPLAAAQATVESTLNVDNLSLGEAQSALQTLERQTQRLSRLVQDLLFLCRLDLPGVPSQPEFCSLNDLIDDLIEEFEPLAINHQVALSAEAKTNQPLRIIGDEAQLYRLVTNLLVNAIQYTPPGGSVWVFLEQEHHQAIIRVQDTGIGIASEEQQYIFNRFYRVMGDRSRQTGGTGLGLAIAQGIVNAHHGSLKVSSQLGQGSTFTVCFPL
jgi:signal transduction histidine kinase